MHFTLSWLMLMPSSDLPVQIRTIIITLTRIAGDEDEQEGSQVQCSHKTDNSACTGQLKSPPPFNSHSACDVIRASNLHSIKSVQTLTIFCIFMVISVEFNCPIIIQLCSFLGLNFSILVKVISINFYL